MPIPKNTTSNVRKSAKDLVLSTVQDWIVTGVLQPGEKIQDSELAKYFSVSRTPAREAIQSLADLGLVEVVPSCGTRVAEIDWNDVQKCYELLAELQILAAKLALPLLNTKDFSALRKINQRFQKAVENSDVTARQKADSDFHGYLIDKADNYYLREYIDQLLLKATRIENLYFSLSPQQNVSIIQHEKIISGLESGNFNDVEDILRRNWLDGLERVRPQK